MRGNSGGNMRVAIVDDEKHWRDTTAKVVKGYYQMNQVEVHTYACGEDFFQKGMEYNIVFLDVEMNQLDGFQTAIKYKKIYPDSIIIMFTMHTELSRKGYLVDAFRYIGKESMESEICEALDSVDKLFEQNRKIELNVVKVGIIRLMLKDILYIETDKRNIKVHTRKEDIICSDKINDVYDKIKLFGFHNCHKSYIVNLDAVDGYDEEKGYVCLVDGSKAMVGVRKFPELRAKVLERKFEKANG